LDICYNPYVGSVLTGLYFFFWYSVPVALFLMPIMLVGELALTLNISRTVLAAGYLAGVFFILSPYVFTYLASLRSQYLPPEELNRRVATATFLGLYLLTLAQISWTDVFEGSDLLIVEAIILSALIPTGYVVWRRFSGLRMFTLGTLAVNVAAAAVAIGFYYALLWYQQNQKDASLGTGVATEDAISASRVSPEDLAQIGASDENILPSTATSSTTTSTYQGMTGDMVSAEDFELGSVTFSECQYNLFETNRAEYEYWSNFYTRIHPTYRSVYPRDRCSLSRGYAVVTLSYYDEAIPDRRFEGGTWGARQAVVLVREDQSTAHKLLAETKDFFHQTVGDIVPPTLVTSGNGTLLVGFYAGDAGAWLRTYYALAPQTFTLHHVLTESGSEGVGLRMIPQNTPVNSRDFFQVATSANGDGGVVLAMRKSGLPFSNSLTDAILAPQGLQIVNAIPVAGSAAKFYAVLNSYDGDSFLYLVDLAQKNFYLLHPADTANSFRYASLESVAPGGDTVLIRLGNCYGCGGGGPQRFAFYNHTRREFTQVPDHYAAFRWINDERFQYKPIPAGCEDYYYDPFAAELPGSTCPTKLAEAPWIDGTI
jgi:hypothetical protein